MSRQKNSLRAIALIAGLGASAATANAADLGSFFSGDSGSAPAAQPVEFGTGWYIRGSVGGAYQNQPDLLPGFNDVPSVNKLDWDAEIGGGYQFNQWFRLDATYTYYGEQNASGDGAQVNCPSAIRGYNDVTTNAPIGIFADANQCNPAESSSLQKNLFLTNGYVDLGNWWGVTPYVGAGAGAAYIYAHQTVNFDNASDGSPYRANLQPPAGYPLVYYPPVEAIEGQPLNPQPHYNYGPQNWDYSKSSQKWNFAFALMAGVSYNLTSNAILDIGYRYVNFGSFSGISSLSGELFNKEMTSQEIRIGLRYLID